jgi:hypothetical protein
MFLMLELKIAYVDQFSSGACPSSVPIHRTGANVSNILVLSHEATN